MKIRCIGGGPAALYFSLLVKKAHPDWDVQIFERNPANVTWGFGVVFSDETMESFREADAPSFRAITDAFVHWDDIHIFFKGEKFVSTGHGFAGMQRLRLLQIIEARARELGVGITHDADVTGLETYRDADLIVAADGINSFIRRQHADAFGADVVMRPNKFVWLGSDKRFDAFTFYFNRNAHGLWRAHCYQYMPGTSTFIVECTEATWQRAGLADASEADTIAYCENVFAGELDGAKLVSNMSLWRNFPRVRNRRYFHENIVLLGDALHTAHFSIGSGTKLAMEDGIALANALERSATLAQALAAFQAEREPVVDSLQRAAQVSMEWFEETERYAERMAPRQFAYALLTRSLRINHDNLRRRDPVFVEQADTWVAEQAFAAVGRPRPEGKAPPPIFTPYRLRGLTLENRIVVSPMCQYSAVDGVVGDWHLVHLGSRAIGGAGLVLTEMTCVGPQARITPGCAGIWNDAQVAAWRRIVDFIHGHSQAKVGLQIGHAGRKGSTKLLWEGVDQPLAEGNWEVIAPSAIPYQAFCHRPREMTRADMDAVVADHAAAARRAAAAGFDLLELHMAHGYLLSTFLSPLTNRRGDAYGGAIENRLRFPLEVFAAVRAAWPQDKPMSARISATDWKAGGFSDADGDALVAALKDAGCDIVDVSTGQVVGDQEPQYGRLWQLPFSTRLRLEGGMPTMAIGNIQSFGDANAIIAGGRADLCVLARMHLADPYWTRHAAYEYGWPLPWPNPYQSVSLPYTPRWS
ncbi:MAG: salicylyl-CoA 5-hydroxylase [Betaproteobacteria bacterium SG8_39]|nr:MAG: salicylyl-CoA 5-hydroxylase [Betaproteobacteria bacterium SG8_39]